MFDIDHYNRLQEGSNLTGYVISTLVMSFETDFKNISEGFTCDNRRKPKLPKITGQEIISKLPSPIMQNEKVKAYENFGRTNQPLKL